MLLEGRTASPATATQALASPMVLSIGATSKHWCVVIRRSTRWLQVRRLVPATSHVTDYNYKPGISTASTTQAPEQPSVGRDMKLDLLVSFDFIPKMAFKCKCELGANGCNQGAV
jgi:hypothetical protein